ncbi:MAG TPA: class I SAM-dependent methyltransferase [Burkholderiaceae bacterium]|nr:class I SAM-dependent methyltransferase [Burkholderiaceae bacterium]
MNILERNRQAWNRESQQGNEWTVPVDSATIARARADDWQVVLTPTRAVPRRWFGDLRGKDVLCLASGGGQQVPILAAAGANVVSFDLSDAQLATDRMVAEREGLAIRFVRGDMADLSAFEDAGFDLIFHPASNVFVPDVCVVWRECFRVLRPGGSLLSGMMSPSLFLFDHDEVERTGVLVVKYKLPFSNLTSLEGAEKQRWLDSGEMAEFSHSLDTLIGGQLDAGLVLVALFEDNWTDDATLFNRYAPVAFATWAVKPASNLVAAR